MQSASKQEIAASLPEAPTCSGKGLSAASNLIAHLGPFARGGACHSMIFPLIYSILMIFND